MVAHSACVAYVTNIIQFIVTYRTQFYLKFVRPFFIVAVPMVGMQWSLYMRHAFAFANTNARMSDLVIIFNNKIYGQMLLRFFLFALTVSQNYTKIDIIQRGHYIFKCIVKKFNRIPHARYIWTVFKFYNCKRWRRRINHSKLFIYCQLFYLVFV